MDNNLIMVRNRPLQHRRTKKPPKPAWEKNTASVSRWLHIYLSMVSFIIVLFFAVSGLTLNHANWFEGKEIVTRLSGKVLLKWVKVKDTTAIAKLEIVQLIKHAHNIRGDVSDFFIDDNQCTVSFKGPGYSAEAFVDRQNGGYKLTETRRGLVATINDLHTGRDTGKKWSFLIDAAGIFMTLLSITGIIMICFIKKKRLKGFILIGVGALLCYLAYYFLVGR